MIRIIIFIFAFVLNTALAQQPQLYFKKITRENGLSHNKVKCILQDRRGFVWLGTEDGLNRFDGTHFTVFRHQPDDSSTISGNIITDILEDKDGILWIATEDGGLNRYDYRLSPSKQFRQFKHQPGDTTSIPVNVINSLLQDREGHLWLATSGASVLRFNIKTEKFDVKIKVGRSMYDLVMDANGIIWAGRQGGSILKINPKDNKVTTQKEYENFYKTLPHVVVTSLYRDSNKDIWFGSWDKAVYRYNYASQKEEAFPASTQPFAFGNDEAIAFNEDRERRMWIGGKKGLYIYDKIYNRFYHFEHDPSKEGSLVDNMVNCIFTDRAGNTWLGTNGGISVYNPQQRQFRQLFLSDPDKSTGSNITVYDFLKRPNHQLWIGSSEGIFIREPNGRMSLHSLTYKGQKLAVTKFFTAQSGSLYVGTNVSLFLLDENNISVSELPNTEKDMVMRRLIESRVVSVVEANLEENPVLLVSPYGHFVTYYDLEQQQWVSRQDSIKRITKRYNMQDNLVRKMANANGRVWLANFLEGLGEWDVRNGKPILFHKNDPSSTNSITSNSVFDILPDNRGNLWIGTYGGGLNYYDTRTGKFNHINETDNLLEGIQTDNHGNVWMISNGNIHKYDTRNKSYTSYEVPDIEKTGGLKGYIYKDNDGNFYVAGRNYFTVFHPDSIKQVQAQPNVIFTDLKIFNNSVSHLLFEKNITLRHNQNFFTFEFAAPEYSGSPVQYSYMLERVNTDWVDAGTNNSISYSNLGGGDYRFRVRATTRTGVWNEDFSVVAFTIIPPFWQTWWFYLTCALMVGLIIYSIYRYRINELLKRQAIRNKIAQDLHDNVGSTLSSISVYSQVAKIYNQQEKETELKNTLEKISFTSSEMISEMNDIVWAINPRNDNMEKILQRMESFARPLLATREIKFHFNYDPAVAQLNLEMTKRKNFYLIFKEAVNNALKYSDCKNLWVEIRHEYDLNLTVKDDGKGFDKKATKANSAHSLSGNGLRNMEMRATEMKGACVIKSVPGQGTSMTLWFPIP